MSDNKTQDLVEKWKKVITVPVREGNNVKYLIDGTATFYAMYVAILTTFSKENLGNYFIYMLNWYLDDNIALTQGGSTLKELLKDASDTYKVQIRAMVWGNPDPFDYTSKNSVANINSLTTGAAIYDKNTLFTLGAHHQKVLIVNGKQGMISFCGGVDFNKDRIIDDGKQKGSPMHDVHCQIRGRAAYDLLDVFLQRWLGHPEHNKIDQPVKNGGKGPITARNLNQLVIKEPLKSEHYVGIARTFNFVGNGQKCIREQTIKSTITNAIRASERFIYIEDQYLWNIDAAEELGKVLYKIQHLTMLISHADQIIDSKSIIDGGAWAHTRFVQKIKANSNEVHHQKIKLYYRIKKDSEDMQYIHSKTWIFDDELAVIGSANCNFRGWESDSEVIAAIFDKPKSVKEPSFAQTLRMKLWAEHLGVEEINLRDGVVSKNSWPTANSKPSPKCYARWYDLSHPSKYTDWTNDQWDIIDPGIGKTPVCGENTIIAK